MHSCLAFNLKKKKKEREIYDCVKVEFVPVTDTKLAKDM